MSKYQFEDEPSTERPTFEQALEALQRGDAPQAEESILYGLSDITEEQAVSLMPVWQNLDPQYRSVLLQILVDEMASNFDLAYDQLALQTLKDSDERVRRTSIELLVATEDRAYVNVLLRLVESDTSALVRVDGMRAVAEFCHGGAYEDLANGQLERIESLAYATWSDESRAAEERGAALELMAATDTVPAGAINQAYDSNDETLKMSAIIAMGNTADPEQWQDIVLDELEHGLPSIQREAARASGALQLMEAVPLLIRLLADEEADAKEEIIWSLGEIGGKESLRVLNALAEDAEDDEDDELLEQIEEALANASMKDGSDFLNILT